MYNMHVCTYIHTHIHTYICSHTHTHTHIHTHVHLYSTLEGMLALRKQPFAGFFFLLYSTLEGIARFQEAALCRVVIFFFFG
jgi:hypothetical protein